MTEETGLKDLREEIAEVTLEIFRLCARRIQLAKKIAGVKSQKNKPLEDLKVEQELRERVLGVCHDRGIDKGFCVKLFELLIDESKRVQRETLKSQL